MKNNIPNILQESGLTVTQLHTKIIRSGETLSYRALLRWANPSAPAFSDRVELGTLRKIAGALGVGIADLFGEAMRDTDER